MIIKKKILALSGSIRKNSSNEIILKNIAEIFKDQLEVEIYDLESLPHFNPDLDNENPPQVIQEFRTKIKSANGILICSPEYVFSIPSVLKNAIEWNVSTMLFSKKPTAFIIASTSGEEAFTSLELILKTVETEISENSKLLIKGAKGMINENNIIDEITISKIKKLTNSLIETIDKQPVANKV